MAILKKINKDSFDENEKKESEEKVKAGWTLLDKQGNLRTDV